MKKRINIELIKRGVEEPNEYFYPFARIWIYELLDKVKELENEIDKIREENSARKYI